MHPFLQGTAPVSIPVYYSTLGQLIHSLLGKTQSTSVDGIIIRIYIKCASCKIIEMMILTRVHDNVSSNRVTTHSMLLSVTIQVSTITICNGIRKYCSDFNLNGRHESSGHSDNSVARIHWATSGNTCTNTEMKICYRSCGLGG